MLSSVHHPNLCRAEIRIRGSVRDFHEGDSIKVGPTPLSKLVVEGTVEGKDETSNILILEIDDMRAPVGSPSH